MVPRENWTDQRLDDLNRKVDDGFARVDKKMDDGFARVDKKMDDGFARVDKKVDEGLAEARDRFDRLETQIRQIEERGTEGYNRMGERLHALNMTLIAGFFVMAAAMIGAIASIIAIAAF